MSAACHCPPSSHLGLAAPDNPRILAQRTFLSFHKGDLFTVLDRGTTDWWEVTRDQDGARGFVPLNHVEAVPAQPQQQQQYPGSQQQPHDSHKRTSSAHKVLHLFAM